MDENPASENWDLWLFFGIAFAWSWLFQLPRVLSSSGLFELHGSHSFILGTVAVFGPSVAAFGLTYTHEGRAGLLRLWKLGWALRFRRIWLIPILLLMPAITLIDVLLLMLLGHSIPWELGVPVPMIVPIFLWIFFLQALPEEYGWRGYALDRLQRRWNALTASLILGALWGLWHLPLHFISGTTQEVVLVWQFILHTMVLAVLFTWLHNNTGSSVLVAILFHTIGNTASAVAPWWATGTGRWIAFTILLVVAAAILLIWKPQKLGP
jgi:membrane protease YdiL (CAAX protease family)